MSRHFPTPPQPGIWPATAPLVLGLAAAGLLSLGVVYLAPWQRSCNGPTCEDMALDSLREIHRAQSRVFEESADQKGKGTFAPTLSALTSRGPERDHDLIDAFLASGRKQGYAFEVRLLGSDAWVAQATPLVPGTTGDRAFAVNQQGTIFWVTCDGSATPRLAFRADGSARTGHRLGEW